MVSTLSYNNLLVAHHSNGEPFVTFWANIAVIFIWIVRDSDTSHFSIC